MSEAYIAQRINALATPPIVACVECGTAITLTKWARLYCSDVCKQTLKLIHYGRGTVADGRIGRDPTIEEALQMRVAQILGGGYHESARRVSPAMRAQVFERDGYECVLCGAPATQIDHIADDANTPENLRATCGPCNLGMAQAHLAPAPPSQAALADQLFERIFAEAPVFPRDDEAAWGTSYARILAERRGQLRAHRIVRELLQRAKRSAPGETDL